jgi:ribose transport system substrate-binding protein
MRTSVGVIAALAVLVLGCGQKTSGHAVPPKTPLEIAVIPKGSTHEFWKSVNAGALAAGRELNVRVRWKGPLKEDDRDDQIKVIEDFVTAGVDGIVLAPLDDTALRQPVAAAQLVDIPVLIIDSGLKDTEVVSFVATDNHAAGKLGGERLAKLMNGNGKVILLRYQEGSASTREREEGFLAAMKANPGIEVISSNQFAGATTDTAQKASENLLQRFRSSDGAPQFGGVFCPNESSTFGMLRALQDAGIAGKVRFVGFDASTKLVEALEGGTIDALVVQNPFQMGYLGVKNMVAHLRREMVEKRVDTGAIVVDKAGLSEPETARLVGKTP